MHHQGSFGISCGEHQMRLECGESSLFRIQEKYKEHLTKVQSPVKSSYGTVEMTPCAKKKKKKCLLNKQKELSSDPQHPGKKPGTPLSAWNSSTGRQR